MFQQPNTKGRPILTLEWKFLDILLEAAAGLCIIVATVIVLSQYGALPDRIPTHYNAHGAADDYGSKSSLFFLLAINFGTYLMITWVTRMPQNFNYPVQITAYNAAYQYRLSMRLLRWIKLAIALNFSWMLYAAIQSVQDGSDRLPAAFIISFFGSLFIPLVVYFYLASRRHK